MGGGSPREHGNTYENLFCCFTYGFGNHWSSLGSHLGNAFSSLRVRDCSTKLLPVNSLPFISHLQSHRIPFPDRNKSLIGPIGVTWVPFPASDIP